MCTAYICTANFKPFFLQVDRNATIHGPVKMGELDIVIMQW